MKSTSIPTKNILSFQIDPELFEPATEEQKRQQEIDKPGMSFFRDALRRLAAAQVTGPAGPDGRAVEGPDKASPAPASEC